MSKIRKFLFKHKKGFTLMEVIVAIAILAITSSILAVSYTNVMETQRRQADLEVLKNIDTNLKQIFMYDDAFNEIKTHVYDKNKIHLVFVVSKPGGEHDSFIKLKDTCINGTTTKLEAVCPNLYKYLKDYVGEKIILTAAGYKDGYYRVDIAFNGAKVSDIRDFVITNDSVLVTNSGDSLLHK